MELETLEYSDLRSETEVQLQKALMCSKLMETPTLSYFLKMALVELGEPSDEAALGKSINTT